MTIFNFTETVTDGVISITIRDRANFLNPQDLECKTYFIKFSILMSHAPQGHMTLIAVLRATIDYGRNFTKKINGSLKFLNRKNSF